MAETGGWIESLLLKKQKQKKKKQLAGCTDTVKVHDLLKSDTPNSNNMQE